MRRQEPVRAKEVGELAQLLGELERRGTSVMDLARGGRALEPWTIYPGEYGIFDRKTGSQFYYHAHAGRDHEAGHFHTVRFFPDHTVHLVVVSMSHAGWPQALFTVNGWAIGDRREAPEKVKEYVRQFHIGPRRGPARLVRFINLVFHAFREEIERLQDQKEAALVAHGSTHPDRDPWEDRSLEILSWVDIDLRARLGEESGAGARASS